MYTHALNLNLGLKVEIWRVYRAYSVTPLSSTSHFFQNEELRRIFWLACSLNLYGTNIAQCKASLQMR